MTNGLAAGYVATTLQLPSRECAQTWEGEFLDVLNRLSSSAPATSHQTLQRHGQWCCGKAHEGAHLRLLQHPTGWERCAGRMCATVKPTPAAT